MAPAPAASIAALPLAMPHRTSFQPTLCTGEPGGNLVVAHALKSGPIYTDYRHVHPRTTYHWQAGIEVHLTVEGRAQFGVGRRVYNQMPRQGLVFRADTPHQYVADPSLRFVRNVLCFVPEHLPLRIGEGGLMTLDWLGPTGCFPFRLGEADFVRVDEMWRRLRLETHLHVHGAAETCVALVVMMLAMVRRNPADGDDAPKGAAFARQRGDLVHLGSIYVRDHLADDLSLPQVARLFGVSPEHLTRSFRRYLGVSFHQHVLSERVAAAKERLRAPGRDSVTDVAFATGFQSSSHFNKVFKQYTGMTPTAFRAGEGAAV